MVYNYPREIYETRLKNLNLKIIAVDHKPSFLTENEDFFRKEVNNPDYVFFEMGLEKSEFYKNLAELIEDKDKSIYSPDSLYKGFEENDIILGVAGAGLLTKSTVDIVRKRKLMSRRDFLKKAGMGLAGLYLGTGIMGFREDMLEKIFGKNITFDNKISYDATQDFRNIISSDNINRAAGELNFEGNAAYFIGYNHLNGLRAYMNNPKMRRKRKLKLTS